MHVIDELDIKINDLFVSYTDECSSEHSPAVVFVHGFPLNKSMWNGQVEALRTKYRIITYDVRGYGNSEAGTQEFTIDLFVSDLIQLMDALALKKVILCGFSMGGYIALRAAEQFPERLDALILCDTQCAADTVEAKEKRMKSIRAIRLGGLELYADQILSSFLFTDSLNTKSKEMIEVRRMIESNSSEVVCNTLKALADRSETCSNLHKIEIPALILVGEEDTVTPPSAAEFMQSKVAGSMLFKLKKSAHLSCMDNVIDFNKHVEDFLDLVTQKKL